MKKLRKLICFLIIITFITGGCEQLKRAGHVYNSSGRVDLLEAENSIEATPFRFVRSDNHIDFSGVLFNPWDVAEASKQVESREKKPYTIMIYMNGSDLESEDGAATDDIVEMLDSGLDAEMANVVIFTGGTNRWQNDVIPENQCMLWEIRDGLIYEIAGIGLVNMGDAGTLSSFIDFGVNNFPAEKYGLILWDHGGGSIAGYGHDEKFNNSNLTLLDMNYAFKRSVLSKKKLEFLGFDSCLMASSEMAVIASVYANHLIASEDLEPGEGWDYGFLSFINDNPHATGAELGRVIVDSFMAYYGRSSGETLTLSVTELSNIGALANAVDILMERCSESLSEDVASSFKTLARKRNGTKTFGEGSPRDNDCDMVDLGDMAAKLSDLFPREAANVLRLLEECVVYNRHNSYTDLKGLSVYYIYGGKSGGREALDLYAALQTNQEHAEYLGNFFNLLVSGGAGGRTRSAANSDGKLSAVADDEIADTKLALWEAVGSEQGNFIMTGLLQGGSVENAEGIMWPTINGRNVCMYKINSTQSGETYAVPAQRNGKDCDIVLLYDNGSNIGQILGARNEDGLIIQKGFDSIKEGDKIAFLYEKRLFDEEGSVEAGWHMGDEFTVTEELTLGTAPAKGGGTAFTGNVYTDIRHNRIFDFPVPIR